MYGMAQKIPDSSLVEEIAENFIDALYTTKWNLFLFQATKRGLEKMETDTIYLFATTT